MGKRRRIEQEGEPDVVSGLEKDEKRMEKLAKVFHNPHLGQVEDGHDGKAVLPSQHDLEELVRSFSTPSHMARFPSVARNLVPLLCGRLGKHGRAWAIECLQGSILAPISVQPALRARLGIDRKGVAASIGSRPSSQELPDMLAELVRTIKDCREPTVRNVEKLYSISERVSRVARVDSLERGDKWLSVWQALACWIPKGTGPQNVRGLPKFLHANFVAQLEMLELPYAAKLKLFVLYPKTWRRFILRKVATWPAGSSAMEIASSIVPGAEQKDKDSSAMYAFNPLLHSIASEEVERLLVLTGDIRLSALLRDMRARLEALLQQSEAQELFEYLPNGRERVRLIVALQKYSATHDFHLLSTIDKEFDPLLRCKGNHKTTALASFLMLQHFLEIIVHAFENIDDAAQDQQQELLKLVARAAWPARDDRARMLHALDARSSGSGLGQEQESLRSFTQKHSVFLQALSCHHDNNTE